MEGVHRRPCGAVAADRLRSRFLSLFVPREHGSWGMLLTVLILPPAALGAGGAAWWFIAASAVSFFARRPLEVWLQTADGPDRAARAAFFVLTGAGLALGGAGAAAAASVLVVLLCAVSAVLIAFSAFGESLPRRRGGAGARLAGAAGMCALVLVQAAASFGRIPPAGWWLAALCFAAFLGSGLRVRSVVRARRVAGFRTVSLAVHGMMLGAAAIAAWRGWLPPLAPAALAPGFVQSWRILKRDSEPVNTLRMGIGEICHTAAFAAAVILAYRLAPA